MYVSLKNARSAQTRVPGIVRGALAVVLALLGLVLSACSGGGPAPETDPGASLAEAQTGRWSQPGEPYWPYLLASIHADLGQSGQAHAQLDSSLALDDGYEPAIALRSKLLFDEGRHDQAITLLKNHVDGHPDGDDALRAALALHLDAVGAWEESDVMLAACNDGTAQVITVRTFLGLRGEDPLAAIDAAERALKADPESAANLNNHGIALLYAGRPAEARQAFLAALERDEDLSGALYNLAIVDTYYFYDEEAGRQWFARYQTLASDDPDDLATALGVTLTTASREEDQ